jgi:hydroxymethylglutaryl-CoA reductase
MKIICVAGLAQNFAAIRSLITSGIQKGHMKMHLLNILNQIGVKKEEKLKAIEYFKNDIVSHKKVEKFIRSL